MSTSMQRRYHEIVYVVKLSVEDVTCVQKLVAFEHKQTRFFCKNSNVHYESFTYDDGITTIFKNFKFQWRLLVCKILVSILIPEGSWRGSNFFPFSPMIGRQNNPPKLVKRFVFLFNKTQPERRTIGRCMAKNRLQKFCYYYTKSSYVVAFVAKTNAYNDRNLLTFTLSQMIYSKSVTRLCNVTP